jgi:hypothetical protein
MSYIGNTNTTQGFIPAIDYFSGNGSTVAFTLSRPVASVAQVQANISNVPQNPSSAFSVSGNTITFTSAPPSGSNNIYVYYTSPITQVIAPSQGTVSPTSLSTGGPTWDASGNVGIGTTSPATKLEVDGAATTNNTSRYVARFGDTSSVAAGNGGGIMFQGVYTGTTLVDSGGIQSYKDNATSGDYAYSMTFATRANGGNLTERMRIDSSGNVGIGTSSPTAKLHVADTTGAMANFISSAAGGGNIQLSCTNAGTTVTGYVGSNAFTANVFGIGTSTSTPVAFFSAGSERARIDTSGNFLIGKTTASASGNGFYVDANGSSIATIPSSNTYHVYSSANSTYRFYVNINGGISNFSANNVNLSDERVKKNIELSGGYLAKICAIPVKLFNYKDEAEGEQRTLGVIAQDVEAVAPELVNNDGWVGEEPEDGVPFKTIYQTDLQYALMKCIQEQQALITTLTDRITALENK